MEEWKSSRFDSQLAFIQEIDRLKSVQRQSVLMDGSRNENAAEHSWHICVFAMLMHEYTGEMRPDLNRVIRMLLIHDIVEVDAGDTFAYDRAGNKDKKQREMEAAERLFGLLPDDQRKEWVALWQEFEAMETPEALFANAADRLLPLLHNYRNNGISWRRNGVVRSQVEKRIAPVRQISPELWRFGMDLLERAVRQGMLEDA
jgi:putative hydrolase of HD superfamily